VLLRFVPELAHAALDAGANLGSILRNRFGRSLLIKLNSVELKFVIMTVYGFTYIMYLFYPRLLYTIPR
jgi:hypothetical protein